MLFYLNIIETTIGKLKIVNLVPLSSEFCPWFELKIELTIKPQSLVAELNLELLSKAEIMAWHNLQKWF